MDFGAFPYINKGCFFDNFLRIFLIFFESFIRFELHFQVVSCSRKFFLQAFSLSDLRNDFRCEVARNGFKAAEFSTPHCTTFCCGTNVACKSEEFGNRCTRLDNCQVAFTLHIDNAAASSLNFFCCATHVVLGHLNENFQEKISSGDLLTLRVDAITKEYATFINNAQAELWGSDPLFSGPPANVETNIRSKTPSEQIRISGFFTAFSGDQASRMYE